MHRLSGQHATFLILALLLALNPLLINPQSLQTPVVSAAPHVPTLEGLPLVFETNVGQTDSTVRFVARGEENTYFFTSNEVVFTLATPTNPPADPHELPTPGLRHVVRVQWLNTAATATLTAGTPLPGQAHYFLGNDPTHWRTNVSTYSSLVYHNLYSGIDLTYSGAERQLKGTYLVAPGANPSQIQWRYRAGNNVQLAADGNLQISLRIGTGVPITVTEQAPVAWQTIDGQQIGVPTHYTVAPNGSVGFSVGAYNPTLPLTIDPIITYSTYLGGSGADEGRAIAVDSAGSLGGHVPGLACLHGSDELGTGGHPRIGIGFHQDLLQGCVTGINRERGGPVQHTTKRYPGLEASPAKWTHFLLMNDSSFPTMENIWVRIQTFISSHYYPLTEEERISPDEIKRIEEQKQLIIADLHDPVDCVDDRDR